VTAPRLATILGALAVANTEGELGLSVFVRQGKRLASLTPAGEIVVATARRAMREIGNLKRVADEFRGEDVGTLAIATTHTQARYVLPKVLREFASRYPKVRVILHQGNPVQVAEQTATGEADVGIATEALADHPQIVTLPCYEWNRVVLVPKRHPLAKVRPLTLEALVKHPIVTYDFSFTGRSAINAAFAAKGLDPVIVLTALDSDVIKTYVELGMGVGIVAQMAYDPSRDGAFEMLDAGHLFAPSVTRLGLRKGVFVRGFVYAFISLFAPQYGRAAVDAALESRTRR
jgi:LysR family cys regulon transcriptional activator